MPPKRRTPRIAPFQPDRRIRASEATATVAATRTLESAINATAPPADLLALVGTSAGIVSAGGARTGGCGPAVGSEVLAGADEADLVGEDDGCGATTARGFGCRACVGGAERLRGEVGPAVGTGVRVGCGGDAQQC